MRVWIAPSMTMMLIECFLLGAIGVMMVMMVRFMRGIVYNDRGLMFCAAPPGN